MKILFLSDLHLGADYIADHRAHERLVTDFLEREGSSASHIYLLGDILDYWYEYRHVVPKGFIRFFATLANLADNGVKITWLTGNHDIWLFGYFRSELGIDVVDAPYIERTIRGKNFILAHGDRIGHQSLGFRMICSLFRNRLCQRLYSSLHPGITVPFAKRWSRSSRKSGRELDPSSPHFIKRIEKDAAELARLHPATDYIIEGHHHIALEKRLDQSATTLIVLGDWIDKYTYAEFDGTNIILKKFVY